MLGIKAVRINIDREKMFFFAILLNEETAYTVSLVNPHWCHNALHSPNTQDG